MFSGSHMPEYGPTPDFDLGISQDDLGNQPGPSKKTDKGRIRPKSKISKFYSMVSQLRADTKTFEKRAEKIRLSGFGGVLEICNWNALSTVFVKWVVDNWEVNNGPQIRLSKTKVLKITEEDVHRVYQLPRGEKRIDLLDCSDKSIQALRTELDLPTEESSKYIHFNILESKLKSTLNTTTWVKCAILYTTYCLLCPVNSNKVDLRYAAVLKDVEQIPRYNWCRHILEHTTKGINNNNRLNPTADFHFLLINYLERMGKKCRLLSGHFQAPSLAGWDEGTEMLNLHAIEDMVELSKGVAVGITKERMAEESKPFITFDPDECPLEKIPKYTNLCNNYVEAYTECLEKMRRRMQAVNEEYITATKASKGKDVEKGQTSNTKKQKKRKEPAEASVVNLREAKKKTGKNINVEKEQSFRETRQHKKKKIEEEKNIPEDDEELLPGARIRKIKTKVAAQKKGKKVSPATTVKGKGLEKEAINDDQAQEEPAVVPDSIPKTDMKSYARDKSRATFSNVCERTAQKEGIDLPAASTFATKGRVKHIATWRTPNKFGPHTYSKRRRSQSSEGRPDESEKEGEKAGAKEGEKEGEKEVEKEVEKDDGKEVQKKGEKEGEKEDDNTTT